MLCPLLERNPRPFLTDLLHAVKAQHPIAFKLRLAEELVGSALVWKQLAVLRVVENVGGLATAYRGFNIDQGTVCFLWVASVYLRIANLTNRAILPELVALSRIDDSSLQTSGLPSNSSTATRVPSPFKPIRSQVANYDSSAKGIREYRTDAFHQRQDE